MYKCEKCGAPTRPNADGDKRYDPPRAPSAFDLVTVDSTRVASLAAGISGNKAHSEYVRTVAQNYVILEKVYKEMVKDLIALQGDEDYRKFISLGDRISKGVVAYIEHLKGKK